MARDLVENGMNGMDMQVTVSPNFLNLLFAIGLGLVVVSLGWLRYLAVVENTRRAFGVLQPDIHVTRGTTMYSNGEDALTLRLCNCGGSQAFDVRVTVHGGEGHEPLPVISVMNPGGVEQEIWVKAKSESPLLQEKRDGIRLWIRYRDQWGYSYRLSYPVVQRESIHGWVALQLVEKGKPLVTKPSVSFLRMRKYLRQQAVHIRMEGRSQKNRSDDSHIAQRGWQGQSRVHPCLNKVWSTQNKRYRILRKTEYGTHALRVS